MNCCFSSMNWYYHAWSTLLRIIFFIMLSLFYQENKETTRISEKIQQCIDAFLLFLDQQKYQWYVRSFGLVWPTARGEWFYKNTHVRSDIDFFLITKKISFSKKKTLHTHFKTIFSWQDASLLFFWPSIEKKPDLMRFELTNNGQFLYGEPMKPLSLDSISRWEWLRNLVYRGCYFLRLLDKNDTNSLSLIRKDLLSTEHQEQQYIYAFSKVVFALGEVILLLERTYTASNIQRNQNVQQSPIAQHIPWFCTLHQDMHGWRYHNKKMIASWDMIKQAIHLLYTWYTLLYKELFHQDIQSAFTLPQSLQSTWIGWYANRILFSFSYYVRYNTIRFHRKEPFVILIEMMVQFLYEANYHKKYNMPLLWKILKYRATASRFYKPS